MKDVTDILASDIYMYLNKRLYVWLNESPKKRKEADDYEEANRDLMGGRGTRSNNRDLLGNTGMSKDKDEKLEYGLNKWEIQSLTMNLDAFDKEYEKF